MINQFLWKIDCKDPKVCYNKATIFLNIHYMQFDHHPFMTGHPELQDAIHALRSTNIHFAKLLREYDGICLEIGRAESSVPGYMMSDIDLEQLKKERLALKDDMLAMLV